jgi:hypothetical protein
MPDPRPPRLTHRIETHPTLLVASPDGLTVHSDTGLPASDGHLIGPVFRIAHLEDDGLLRMAHAVSAESYKEALLSGAVVHTSPPPEWVRQRSVNGGEA